MAEHDPVRDDGERFAERLRNAGVRVTDVRLPGAIHHALGADGASTLIEHARAFLASAAGSSR